MTLSLGSPISFPHPSIDVDNLHPSLTMELYNDILAPPAFVRYLSIL